MALVGYMGSGKTTVGRLLARSLGREFVDLDRAVEREAGRSIPEIFAAEGEKGFRDLEHRALRRALGWTDGEGRVVACGGGIVERPENRELLRGAKTVFLEEDIGTLFGRTRGAGRPLRGAGRQDFEDRYRRRLPLYKEVADLRVTVDGRPPGTIAEEVSRWLSRA